VLRHHARRLCPHNQLAQQKIAAVNFGDVDKILRFAPRAAPNIFSAA